MNIPILLEDLILNFRQQRYHNRKEVELADKMVRQLKEQQSKQFWRDGFSLIVEFILWLAILVAVIGIIFMGYFYPFSIISNLKSSVLPDGFLPSDLSTLAWVLRLMFLIIGLLCFWTVRLLAKHRAKGKLQKRLLKELEGLTEALLQGQSAIHELSNKYPVDLEENSDEMDEEKRRLNSGSKKPPDNHNDILL